MNKINGRLDKPLEKGNGVFIAKSADVLGDCTLKDHVSIWYNVTVRGDVERIEIGKCSNVQDGTVIHVTKDKYPTIIGDYVTIGHNATLHGCTIKNNVLIGLGSIILDNSVISENSIVAAGALVAPGKTFPPNSMIMGSPAKAVRSLSDEEVAGIRDYADRYVAYKNIYLERES